MNRLTAFVVYWQHRLGWPLVVGILLIAVSITEYFGLAVPKNAQLHYLKHHLAQMRAGIGQRQQLWIPESPQAAINTFYQFLPSERTIPDATEKIFDAAFDNNLDVEKGEYQYTREHDAAFSRYQVTLPVVGTYLSVRNFVNRVLKEIPSATLDDIEFSRDDVRSTDVSATVRFTLYLKTSR